MKFSIRDLLLVTVIVALAVGWWVDHRSLAPDAQQHRENMARLREYQDKVKHGWYDFQGQSLPNSSAPAPNPPKP